MLNCVLGAAGINCKHYNHEGCEKITTCDQYEQRIRRCDICKITLKSGDPLACYADASGDVLCGDCSVILCNYKACSGDRSLRKELKYLVVRTRKAVGEEHGSSQA